METSLGRTNATVLPALLLGALLASCGKPLASKPSSPRAPDVTAKIAVESYFPLTDQSQWTYRVQDFVKKLTYLSKVRVHGPQFVDSLKRDGIGVEERYSSFGPGGPYVLEEQEPILYFHENGYLNRILLTYQAGKVVAASGSGDTQFLPEALTNGATWNSNSQAFRRRRPRLQGELPSHGRNRARDREGTGRHLHGLRSGRYFLDGGPELRLPSRRGTRLLLRGLVCARSRARSHAPVGRRQARARADANRADGVLGAAATLARPVAGGPGLNDTFGGMPSRRSDRRRERSVMRANGLGDPSLRRRGRCGRELLLATRRALPAPSFAGLSTLSFVRCAPGTFVGELRVLGTQARASPQMM